MEILKDAENIFLEVEKLAGSKIANKEDLLRIISLAFQNDNVKILEDLSFQAKFTQGLLKIINTKDNSIQDEYFSTVKKEFGTSVETIKNLLKAIISNSDNFYEEIIEKKYFQLSHQSLSNLSILCNDLSYLKLYLNDQKRLDVKRGEDLN